MADATEIRLKSGREQQSSEFSTPIALDRDHFMRRLIASLGYLNEGILGSDIAGAYIMNVGLSMGAAIETEYKRFWGIERSFTIEEYAHVIVDLKQKIKGNFSLVSLAPEKVVVQTTSCPFDEFVRQSPSLCFMTSSVFGGIAARNFGYAKVVLHKRIALGDDGCYVTVFLQPTAEAEASAGKEYYPDTERASADIAEQLRLMQRVRQLREELGEVNSLWEEVVRRAADAIMITDPKGKVLFANARWRELAGIEGNELTGGSLLQIAHADDHKAARRARRQALQGRYIINMPLRIHHRDGSWRDCQISVSPIRHENGQITGLLAIAHDVTEEREAQRLKDDFLITASHELRTPLSTIKAITQVLLRQLERDDTGAGIDPAQLAKRLRTIQHETDRLALLGSDLADAVRLQQGRINVNRERHNLNAVAASSLARIQDSEIKLNGHEIILRASATPLPVDIDSRRIEQILGNLLDNAIKYSPMGGHITITTGRDGNHARVSVSDQGIGIPTSEQPSLFQPFYRASNASTSHFSGLGLGLYLSQAIALAHGGKLSVASSEGQGTTFTLSLPLATDEPGGSPEAQHDAE